MNTYLNHSGILNQLMIDKFTAHIKRTKTSICCLSVGLQWLLQYWIDYWIAKQWRTRVKTNNAFLKLLADTFAICYRPSVCLSSVTSVRPIQAVQIFGNISTALSTLRSYMSFRLVPRSVTLNDLERRNGVISANSCSFRAHCVKVHARYLIYWRVLVLLLTLSFTINFLEK